MAKRKAAGTARRKAARKTARASRKRSAPRKPTRRTVVAKKKVVAKKSARTKTRAAARAGGRRRVARTRTVKKAARNTRSAARKTTTRRAPSKARAPRIVAPRKVPALDRARRTVQGDDIVPTPPSSLDLDRTASAARTGRRELRERIDAHTETSPALTAGDVDADWESAYSTGDEAPGGDNPTPDQEVVDDIGRAVGVQYEDNEELKGEAKISKRDKHRWELDPASSEDYDDR